MTLVFCFVPSQACTGIDDVGEAILILDEVNWDLLVTIHPLDYFESLTNCDFSKRSVGSCRLTLSRSAGSQCPHSLMWSWRRMSSRASRRLTTCRLITVRAVRRACHCWARARLTRHRQPRRAASPAHCCSWCTIAIRLYRSECLTQGQSVSSIRYFKNWLVIRLSWAKQKCCYLNNLLVCVKLGNNVRLS